MTEQRVVNGRVYTVTHVPPEDPEEVRERDEAHWADIYVPGEAYRPTNGEGDLDG